MELFVLRKVTYQAEIDDETGETEERTYWDFAGYPIEEGRLKELGDGRFATIPIEADEEGEGVSVGAVEYRNVNGDSVRKVQGP